MGLFVVNRRAAAGPGPGPGAWVSCLRPTEKRTGSASSQFRVREALSVKMARGKHMSPEVTPANIPAGAEAPIGI